MKTATLSELAELVGGIVAGDAALTITGLNSLELAGPGEISFITSAKKQGQLAETRASACVVPSSIDAAPLPVIKVENPDLASARIHNYLLDQRFVATGIHPSAVIGDDCKISESVSIGPLVTLGDRVHIGQHVTLHPGVVVGDDVHIGDGSTLHANVVVAHETVLGRHVVLFHGAVIGSDGFGFATDLQTGEHLTRPQVGNVVIEEDVQVGANTCIDRAAFATTRVKAGARIDNLVMVGHNCVIGENSVLVGQVGIAGSTTLGRNVVLGGSVGVSGHLHLDDGVQVAAMAGVHSNLKKGAIVGGFPAFDVRQWGRSSAAYKRLPNLLKEVKQLHREVEALKAKLAANNTTENDND